jgi:hypothetical protein
MEAYLNIATAALPGQLLEELGVKWMPAQIAVTVLALIGAIAGGIVGVAKFLRWGRARLRLRDDDEKARVRRRQLFAEFVEGRVRDLNRREEWSDYRFAELEAEVETVGDSSNRLGLGELFGGTKGLRREKSLSRALMRSKERLILLRGDPGSGKSVALRFVARKMAREAMESNRSDSTIPLYINLKDFRRGNREIDGRLIEDFVLENLRRRGDREVDSFLRDEFSAGKAVGGWFFLFDSFDEIPEVLSSTEDDRVVQAYSQAITDFVEGMHSCRGVIASRHFRAPQQQGLPTFRIVPLAETRKLDLVGKADLKELEPQLVANLQSLTPELAALTGNPLFLGLLVEYVKDKGGLPEGWHDVFESFVSRRLKIDRERVMRLFDLSDEELRRRSEEIAFTMTSSHGFGLSPAKGSLAKAYEEVGFTHRSDLDKVIAALAWIKLGRTDDEVAKPEEETFTFAHRRFQEYFATCVVLREPDRVDPHILLTDARWRETAVTLFHAQPLDTVPLLAEAEAILEEAATAEPREGDYRWPRGLLHLLGLLQSAFAGRARALPASLRERVDSFLSEAEERGTLTDRKWALEVAGTVPAEKMVELLLRAFRGPSNWLREVAFRQVARLGASPPEISVEIRRSLIEKVGNRDLQREWPAIRAQVMRLGRQEPFMRTARLLRVIPVIDLGFFVVGVLVLLMTLQPAPVSAMVWSIIAGMGHLSIYPLATLIARGGGGLVGVPSLKGKRIGPSPIASYLVFGAIGLRALVSLIPLGVVLFPDPMLWMVFTFGVIPPEGVGHDGVLIPALIWLYASIWAISGLLTSLRESPPVLAWPFLPFRLVFHCARTIRRVGIKRVLASLAVGSASLAGMAVGGALAGIVFYILPSTLEPIAAPLLALAWPLFLLVGLVGGVIKWVQDWKMRRAWFPADRRSMSAEELLECLGSFKKAESVTKALREVRVRQLLEDAPEGAEVVRDLLTAVDVSGSRSIEAWRTTIFPAWLLNGGAEALPELAAFEDGVPDELAHLLEDLERGNEVPVA